MAALILHFLLRPLLQFVCCIVNKHILWLRLEIDHLLTQRRRLVRVLPVPPIAFACSYRAPRVA